MKPQRITIPETDLTVSPVGFGTVKAGLQWDGADADRVLETYLAGGGNVIDTARAYSNWIPGERNRSERVIGDWIKRRGHRDDFYLFTKACCPDDSEGGGLRNDKASLFSDIDGSLKTLRVDYVDVLFYHRDDPDMPVAELIENMEDLVRAGKIRYYACSNWSTERMQEADAYCAAHGYRGFVANQPRYNICIKYAYPHRDKTMLDCKPEMYEYHRNNPKNLLVPYQSLCFGYIHKMYNIGRDACTYYPYNTPENMRIVKEIIGGIVEKRGVSVTEAALGFFYTRDIPCMPLASGTKISQIEEICASMNGEVYPEDYALLEKI